MPSIGAAQNRSLSVEAITTPPRNVVVRSQLMTRNSAVSSLSSATNAASAAGFESSPDADSTPISGNKRSAEALGMSSPESSPSPANKYPTLGAEYNHLELPDTAKRVIWLAERLPSNWTNIYMDTCTTRGSFSLLFISASAMLMVSFVHQAVAFQMESSKQLS
jgi:hypothetical protein